MKQRIYVSPSANRKNGYPNRYFIELKNNLSEHFEVLDSDNKPWLMQGWALLCHSFKADIFLLSFVETIAFHKLAFLQYLMVRMSFMIMRLRHKKIVFIFHNPKPHKGENRLSASLTKMQLSQSCLVISHSRETAGFAKNLLAEYGCQTDKVHYICHPFVAPSGQSCVANTKTQPADNPAFNEVKKITDDVLIWGNILPYKGVLEFVSSTAVREAGLRVRIIGRCKDSELAAKIEQKVSECNLRQEDVKRDKGSDEQLSAKFVFENRAADFDELAKLIGSSRHVLFPYLPGSVSSSGVLMDTLSMGGNPVGPAVGAFADLAEEGVCHVYHSEEEMIEILKSDRQISRESLDNFIADNSWKSFAGRIADFFDSDR